MVLSIIFLEDKHKILLHLLIFYEYQKKTYEYYRVLIFKYETIFCLCKYFVFYCCQDLFSLASTLPRFGWELNVGTVLGVFNIVCEYGSLR